ncbi:MAG: carbon storage regulator [Singulisphaera sp.]
MRIGVDAPGVVSVHRGEIYDRIQEALVAATVATDGSLPDDAS